MKIKVINYTFDASAKTITFTDYASITLNSILLITNVTDNIIIYNFADPTKGGTVGTNILTLTYNTATMDDTDKLLIYYEDPTISGDTTLLATAAKQLADGHNVKSNSAYIATETTASAINTKLVSGTDIGDVTINNTSGASAVNIQDGGNTITVDGTVGVTGVATETTLGTVHGHVDSIDGKIPALGAAAKAAAIPVTMATDQPDIKISLDSEAVVLGAGTAEIGKLAAGTAEIGKLAAGTAVIGHVITDTNSTTAVSSITAGDNNIGNVDVVTMPVVHDIIDSGMITTVTAVTAITNALPAGTNAIGKSAANSGVDIGDVDVTSVVPGTGATNLGKAIDTTLGATDTGILALAVRDDTLNIRSGTENDCEPLHTDATGALWTDPQGNVAHDAADAGNPLKVGGKAVAFDGTAPGTAVAENDRANFITDLYGREYVETTHPNFWSVSANYANAQTNTSVKATPGANLYLYITDILISNGEAAGYISLLNGSGGAVVFDLYPAINGGGVSNLRTPIRLSVNTALCITSQTVTTHSITICGFIGA